MKKSNLLKYHNLIQIIVDILLVSIIFYVFIFFQNKNIPLLELFKQNFMMIFILGFAWLLCAYATKLYRVTRFTRYYEIIQKVLVQILIFTAFYIALSALHISEILTRKLFTAFILSLTAVMIIARMMYIFLADAYRRQGKNNWNVVFVDENKNTAKLRGFIKSKKNLGLRVCGRFIVGQPTDEEKQIYNFNFVDLKNFIRKNNIKIIFLSVAGKISAEDEENIRHYIYSKNLTVYFIPSVFYDDFSTMEMAYFNVFPVLSYKSFPLDHQINRTLKRIFDFIFAFLACVCVLSWLIPLVALAIKLDDGGKVFYIQKRIGFKGRRFNCLKFRTMRPDSKNGIKKTQKEDDRITRVGSFLRKTSLDEFPQFLNVFWGTMSVVGPRPHMVSEDEYYKKNIRKYYLRHFVPPGITGLAQTSGLRGAVEGISEMEKRISADTYYISQWSFMLDIYIIFKTFINLFKKDEQAF